MQLSNPVRFIDYNARAGIEVRTARGSLTAKAVIVTASTGVLLDNRIKFDPELPRRHQDALERLSLGSYDHIALELPGNPLRYSDEVVFEKSNSTRTGPSWPILGDNPVHHRCRRQVGRGWPPRASRPWSPRAGMAHRALWRRYQEGGQAPPRLPMEQGRGRSEPLGRRPRWLRAGARRALARPYLVRRRSGPRHAVGHRRRPGPATARSQQALRKIGAISEPLPDFRPARNRGAGGGKGAFARVLWRAIWCSQPSRCSESAGVTRPVRRNPNQEPHVAGAR